ncbi:MFS transporter [Rhodococcus baikonurensis]|uniref:MFS transporter n=1 Tax=Rhodococcus baikonurensis TaxID=172041 RepID=UPI00378DDD05
MPRASRRRSHYRLTFAVLIAAAIGFSLLQSLTSPVLGPISEHLGTDRNTVTWVLTAYLISAAVCTPIIGRMGDRVGKERMLVVSMCALALGCLAGVFAPSVGWLIGARILQGVGGGAVPLCFGIIRDEFPERKIAGAVGFTASVVAVGGGIGVVVAGPILDVFGYTGLFWVPFVVTSTAAIAAFPPRPGISRTNTRAHQRAACAAALELARRLSGAAQPGLAMGLDVATGDRTDLAVRAAVLGVGAGRAAQQGASHRHGNDAEALGMDLQRRRAGAGVDAVLGVRLPATVRPGRQLARLRLQRLGHDLGPARPALGGGHGGDGFVFALARPQGRCPDGRVRGMPDDVGCHGRC